MVKIRFQFGNERKKSRKIIINKNMEITYDPRADALNITFKKGRVDKTVEIAPEINLDLDKEGNPLYLEVIGVSEKTGEKKMSEILMRQLVST